MLNNLLEELGYKKNYLISHIRDHENIEIYRAHDFYNQKFEPIYESLLLIQNKLEDLLKDDGQSDLENLFLKGFNYNSKNLNPRMQDIWESVISNPRNAKFITRLSGQILLLNDNKDEIDKIVKKLNSFFSDVAYGTILPHHIALIKNTVSVVEKNKDYFERIYKNNALNKAFNTDVKIIEYLNLLDYSPDNTISEIEKREKKIESLKIEFLGIKTPDLKRTITDRIDNIKEKLKSEKSVSDRNKELNLYQVGSTIALRGENPTLIKLLKEHSSYIFYDPWTAYRLKDYFGEDQLVNTKNLLFMLLEGFSLSYHLTFLETYQIQIEEKLGNRGEEKLSEKFQIVIKWLGQKNQLYDVLRQLKDKTVIGNSYEDLAVFLKQNVDIFRNTSLSTINKELGKNKRPPKNKRLNIDL